MKEYQLEVLKKVQEIEAIIEGQNEDSTQQAITKMLLSLNNLIFSTSIFADLDAKTYRNLMNIHSTISDFVNEHLEEE